MKIILKESQLKQIIKEFMGSIESSKVIEIFDKYLDEKGIMIRGSKDSEFDIMIFIKPQPVKYNEYSKIFSDFENFISIYGWFISYYQINYEIDDVRKDITFLNPNKLVEWLKKSGRDIIVTDILLSLEKKYTEQNEDLDVFYHVTDKKNEKKIMAYGLRPRTSQNKLFNYSGRIYLANDIKTAYVLDGIFKKPESKNQFGTEGTIIFKITLPKSFKTYIDPKAPNSSYVLEPISPKYIEVFEYRN